MPTWALILIILVVVAIVAGIATAAIRQRRTAALRNRFGPEYDRTVESSADQRAAESELRGRQRQRAKLDIKPLPEASRIRYGEEWRVVQERFVDQPTEAVGSADHLLQQAMTERGYPMGDFAAQSDLISVDHPEVVDNYRVAHAIRERTNSGQVSTEELRDALLRYRSLFEEMLRADEGGEGPRAGRADTVADDTPADETPADDTMPDRTKTSTASDSARAIPDEGDLRVGAVPAEHTTRESAAVSEADDDTR